MKKEHFASSVYLVYIFVAAIAGYFLIGNFTARPLNDFLFFSAFAMGTLLLVYLSTIHTYLEIQDNRWLINSGYRTFGKDRIDIFDIKYVYRFSELILKWYGSRMVFYIKTEDGTLRQSSQREINFSNDKIIEFLKRIKQINPRIELDQEYEEIIKGEMETSSASENTVASVEARLKEKGERWE
jgi:hypothetical protein